MGRAGSDELLEEEGGRCMLFLAFPLLVCRGPGVNGLSLEEAAFGGTAGGPGLGTGTAQEPCLGQNVWTK